jgi:hypothetical protein
MTYGPNNYIKETILYYLYYIMEFLPCLFCNKKYKIDGD